MSMEITLPSIILGVLVIVLLVVLLGLGKDALGNVKKQKPGEEEEK